LNRPFQLQTEAGLAAAAVALEDDRKRKLLMKVEFNKKLQSGLRLLAKNYKAVLWYLATYWHI
jgi:hypothetical protein